MGGRLVQNCRWRAIKVVDEKTRRTYQVSRDADEFFQEELKSNGEPKENTLKTRKKRTVEAYFYEAKKNFMAHFRST